MDVGVYEYRGILYVKGTMSLTRINTHIALIDTQISTQSYFHTNTDNIYIYYIHKRGRRQMYT